MDPQGHYLLDSLKRGGPVLHALSTCSGSSQEKEFFGVANINLIKCSV